MNSCYLKNLGEGNIMTVIQKALCDIEIAWEEMKSTPVQMSVKEFEHKLLRQAKRHGIPYSTEIGKWLDIAKRVISDPRISRAHKNLYLAEVDPSELKSVLKKFYKAFDKLSIFAEWSYLDIVAFCNDKSKDERLKAFLRWRALPVAEAFYKRYTFINPRLRGNQARRFYLKMRPVIVFRAK